MTRYRLPSGAVLRRGAVFGCAIVVIWIMFRALHVGVWLGNPSLLVPWLLFAPAGFVGATTTGTFGGGIWAGLAAGLIALLTIPGDYLLFHHLIPGGVVPTTLTLSAAAAVAMMFAAIGAGLAMLRTRSGASRWVFRLGGLTVAWHAEVNGHEEPLGQVPL